MYLSFDDSSLSSILFKMSSSSYTRLNSGSDSTFLIESYVAFKFGCESTEEFEILADFIFYSFYRFGK